MRAENFDTTQFINALDAELKNCALLNDESIQIKKCAFSEEIKVIVIPTDDIFLERLKESEKWKYYCRININVFTRESSEKDFFASITVKHNLVDTELKTFNLDSIRILENFNIKMLQCIILELIDTFKIRCQLFDTQNLKILRKATEIYADEILKYNAFFALDEKRILDLFAELGDITSLSYRRIAINFRHFSLKEYHVCLKTSATIDLKTDNIEFSSATIELIKFDEVSFVNKSVLEILRLLQLQDKLNDL